MGKFKIDLWLESGIWVSIVLGLVIAVLVYFGFKKQ
jgi:hypothetical protein